MQPVCTVCVDSELIELCDDPFLLDDLHTVYTFCGKWFSWVME